MKTIQNRRSIRKYKQRQITNEELDAIIEAGKMAPSARNQQPWYFVAIQKKEIIDEISTLLTENNNAFFGALTVVICFGDQRALHPEQDVALAMENMMLEAEYLGLGSCWVSKVCKLFNDENATELKESFGVDKNYLCYGSLVFGYPDENPEMKPRKENVVTIIR